MDSIAKLLVLLILAVDLTDEQDADSFEVREHTLLRPYPAGRTEQH